MNHSALDRSQLPDHASEHDDRALPIDRVGIRGLRYPIRVLDKNHTTQHTVADLGLYVGLPQEFKGTHMSRFIEVLNSVRGELTIRNLPEVLKTIQRSLEADNAYLDASFSYFIEKEAPVSRARSLMEYPCRFTASAQGSHTDFVLSVSVPVKSLCPCSKAISERGAHNQRSIVDVSIRSRGFVWIEDVVTAVEAVASAPVYALLKREDEKYVTEQAYDNPKFAEDLVRDAVLKLRALDKVTWLKVSVENQESIHNHQAYAEIEWSEGEDIPQQEKPAQTNDIEPFDFGAWLKSSRQSRRLSQSDLATSAGMTASYLSRIESGDRQPSSDHLNGLATALGLDPVNLHLRAGLIPPEILVRIQRSPETIRQAYDVS